MGSKNFLIPILLFVGASNYAFAQQLKIGLEAPSEGVKRTAKNQFKVSITNVSPQDLWIYKDLYKGLEIWVKDRSGKDLAHTLIGALCPPPPPTPEDFLCLKPGQTLSHMDDRSPAELGVKRRGKFTAFATYHYQVEVRSDGEKRLHLVEQPVVSNTIKFAVR